MVPRKYISMLILAASVLTACKPLPSSSMPTNQTTVAAAITIPAPFECSDALGCISIEPGAPIHIAWIQSVSGITAPLGQTNLNGAQIALNEINSQLLGHPVQWDGQDAFCSIEGGQGAATLLAADPTVVAIFGPTCAEEARGALPILSAAGLTMVSSSVLAADLTDPENPDHLPGFLRTIPSNLSQARVAADFAFAQLGLTRAATIQDGSLIAEGLQAEFAAEFTSLGGAITAQETIHVGDTKMSNALENIAATTPQILYVAAFEPEGNLIAQQKCDTAGLENTVMLGADILLANSFPPAAGMCSLGMYITGVNVDAANQVSFLSSYANQFSGAPATGYGPYSYDAMKLILSAIDRVAVADGGGTLHIGRQALRDALLATRDFDGIAGPLTCGTGGDCASAESLVVFQINQENVDGTAPLLGNAPIWRAGN